MRCDIVIPVWNQRVFTEDCVSSIIKNTDAGYRLVIIDNASGKETRAYLEGLAKQEKIKVTLIRNDKNLGFIKAVNQGIGASDSPYICLLNNDTVVMRDWLSIMLNIAESDKTIGIVNPSSNNLGQRPAKGEPVELYAEHLRAGSADLHVELGAAIGFCMLIKREVLDHVGKFDEIYGMGNFEDTDFSRRAVKEGYRCVRACGAYVYHRERSSFSNLKSYDEEFRRNKDIFEFRWGKPRRIAYVMDSPDPNILKKVGIDSVRSARGGDWIWYFTKDKLDLPVHSNIITLQFGQKYFCITAAFKILTKKKKFDEIFVGKERFGKFLEVVSFVHKAKVTYF